MNMRKPKFLFDVKELTHFNTMISGIVASWGESIRTQCFLGHDDFHPALVNLIDQLPSTLINPSENSLDILCGYSIMICTNDRTGRYILGNEGRPCPYYPD